MNCEPIHSDAREADRRLVVPRLGKAGSGRAKTPVTLAFEALRAARRAATQNPGAVLTLRMAPRALAALDGPAAAARADLEARLGQPLRLVPELDPGAPDYEIIPGR